MIICVPVQENRGLESPVSAHFGSAPVFMLADTEKHTVEAIENNNAHHSHGMCHPMAALSGRKVDAVVVGGIGSGALGKLQAAGIAVYQANGRTVAEVIDAVNTGVMQVISMQHACGAHHGHQHHGR